MTTQDKKAAASKPGSAPAATAAKPAVADAPQPEGAPVTKVNWDDSAMETSFANVVHVLSTREEFTFLFGTNRTWNALEANELNVSLSNRIVLTPFAAKRIFLLLKARLEEYERRFGTLNL